jgi:hypothetical protein
MARIEWVLWYPRLRTQQIQLEDTQKGKRKGTYLRRLFAQSILNLTVNNNTFCFATIDKLA